MAAPTRAAVSAVQVFSGFSTGSEYTVTVPSATEGNLLILVFASQDDGAAPLFTVSESGFTEHVDEGNSGSNVCECVLAVWDYVVTASPPSTVAVASTGVSEFCKAVWIEVNGQKSSGYIADVLADHHSDVGGQSSMTIGELTLAVDDCYVLAVAAIAPGDYSGMTTSGTGWSEVVDDDSPGEGYRPGLYVAEKTMSGSGATGDVGLTPGSGTIESAWAQIAIAPQVAAPVLASPTASATSGKPTEWTGSVGLTTAAAATVYAWRTANASAETAADIKTNGIAYTNQSTGTINVASTDGADGVVPGSSGYIHYVANNGSDSNVVVSSQITQDSAYTASAVFDGNTPPTDSILFYATGVHGGADNASALTSAETLTADQYAGLYLTNITDVSLGVITGNTAGAASVISATLAGGDNDWDINDVYWISAKIDTSDTIWVKTPATVSSGSVDIDHYLQDDSETPDTYTHVSTRTINGLSEADGTYDVTVDVDGTITLTPQVELTVSASPGGSVVGTTQAAIQNGQTILTITLTNDTWIAAGTGPIGTTAQSNAIVAGITSAQSEATGWNAQIRDALDNTDLVRTSATVATLTIPATAGYVITADEFITITIPNAVLTTSTTDLGAAAFPVRVGNIGSSGGWYYKNRNALEIRKRRLKRGRR